MKWIILVLGILHLTTAQILIIAKYIFKDPIDAVASSLERSVMSIGGLTLIGLYMIINKLDKKENKEG